jgi:transcriptional regulator with XRE-family HTH domain
MLSNIVMTLPHAAPAADGTMAPMLTGPKLRAIRALRGITQADLAERAGVTQTAIAEYEAGKRDMRGATIRKLCEALGVQVRYIVDGTEISGP